MKDYGKLEDQRASYLAKENYLQSCFTQVSPMDFYRDVFAKGSLQEYGVESDGRGCAVFRFCPDKSTYKKLKDRIYGELRDEVWRDSDAVMQHFAEMFDAIPEDSTEELNRRYDKLDKAFNAGVYRKPGQPIETSWKFDQRVHDDLSELGEAIGKRFAIMAPISYYGKKANGENARYLHAITLDLDGVGIKELKFLIAYFQNDMLPTPTYLVNSGHGMHLYYILEEPEPLYKYARAPITKLKNALIEDVWNARTSTIEGHKDDQPWSQMYRVVGSISKLGTGYPATAYKVGNYTTLEALNDFLPEEDRIQLPLENYRPKGKSGHDLEYWKVNNPDWYRRRILKEFDKAPASNKFPWLYETFKRRMLRSARVGNRYNCMCVLFADAVQCGIPYSEVYEYACSLLDLLNIGVEDPKDLFTQEDIECATKYYVTDFGHFMTLERIEKMTDIKFTRNKRNYVKGQPQWWKKDGVHGNDSRALWMNVINADRRTGRIRKDTRFGAEGGNDATLGGRRKGSKNKVNRAEQVIRDFLQNNPTAKKVEVIKNTGLSKPTVYKYYDKIKEELSCTSKED